MKPVRSDEISEAVTKRKNKASDMRLAARIAVEIISSAAAIIIAFVFLFGITVQHGNDMYPSIRDGDLILYYRLGEILPSEAVIYEARGALRSGRIEAAPGARISETSDHMLTINDRFLPADPDSGINAGTYTADGERLPLNLGDDSWFILNDDRTRTSDSREFGEIKRDRIRGRIVTILRRRSI